MQVNNRMDEQRSRKLFLSVLVAIVVILMIQNFLLVRKNDVLLHKLEAAHASLSERHMLSKGDTVHAFQAIGLDGESTRIDPGNAAGKTLFFMFSTRCPFCVKNVDQWNWIVEQTAGKQVNIAGLCPDSLDRTREFASHVGITFPTFSIFDDSVLTGLKLDLVPQTVLVDSTGRVLLVWGGLLSDKRSREVVLAL
jgi:peroxiredoxin